MTGYHLVMTGGLHCFVNIISTAFWFEIALQRVGVFFVLTRTELSR